VLKREEILTTVWGDDDYFMGRSLDVFISKLRKYLKDDSKVEIVNYHGVGFRLEIGQKGS
jgi:DNA-binding response OmpR family regulator